MHFNLTDRKNPDLRGAVLSGEVHAADLIKLKSDEVKIQIPIITISKFRRQLFVLPPPSGLQ